MYETVLPIVGASYAAASINYRLAPAVTFPAAVHDVHAAIRWLRANAAHYGYDGDRIALWGFSAGGTLTTLIGLSEGVGALDGQLRGVRHDVVVRGRCHAVLRNNRCHGTADPDLVALASPVYHASPDDPPVFVFQGTLDAYLSLSQPESLVEALVSAGVHTELHLVQGAGHGGRTGFYGAAARAVRNFLDVYVRGE